MNDERVEQELRATLLEDDPGAVRDELRRRVAAVPDEVPLRRRFVVRSRPSRLLAAVAAIAALAVIGGTLVGVVGLRSTILGPSPSASLSGSPWPSAPSSVPTPTPNVSAAGLLDAQHGWAVAGHRLWVTADGGSTWQDVTPPAGFGSGVGNPKGVAFHDAQYGWVAINEAFTSPSDPSYGRIDIWRTTDGGQTWTKAQLPKAVFNQFGEIMPQVQLDFLDPGHGFAFLSGNSAKGAKGANDSDLFWTADGGRTWSADRPTGSGSVGVEGTVGFATANDGVIVNALHGSGIVVTHDGGRTWTDAALPLPPGSAGAQLFFGQPVFFDGFSGLVSIDFQIDTSGVTRVYRTLDAGSSWTIAATLPAGYVAISLLDQRRWVAFNGSEVLRTEDAGATWTKTPSVSPSSYSSGPQFVDDATGWWLALEGVPEGSVLLATTDGGVTWHALAPRTAAPGPSTTAPTPLGSGTCTPGDVSLSVKGWGAAGGTTYAVLHATLVGHDPCRLPTAPAVEIVDAKGSLVASGPSLDDGTAPLISTLDLRLGWSSWCGPTPAAPLTVNMTLSSGILSTALPAGFGASCQGVPTGLFVEPVVPSQSPSPPASATASPSPTMPIQTPSPAEVNAAKDAVDRYTAALIRGDDVAAWAMLAPEAQTPWGSLANYTYERSAYFKSVGGRYTIQVWPTDVAPITFWLTATYGASIDLRHAVLVKVDYPALAGNNASFDLYIVSPGANGLAIFSVR
jgi:photosystem II stability/assembly factor-like uncharacterized protein